MTKNIDQLIEIIKSFRDAREWKKFHTPRNLAESLILESSEVLEHFQWKDEKDIKNHLKAHKKEFAYELADVFSYLLLLADATDVRLDQALISKLKISEKKYPVKKSKGNYTKYTQLK